MKTQNSRKHMSPVGVQPLITSEKKQCIKKRIFTKLKLPLLLATAQTGTVYMVTQDKVPSCKTNPGCDTNTLVSFNLGNLAGGKFNITTILPTVFFMEATAVSIMS